MPIVLPLLYEIVSTLCCCLGPKGSTYQFRVTTLIANLLNQEKCLDLPSNPDDLLSYHHEQAKANSNKKLKFIIFEDFLQILIQLYFGQLAGLTGFWSIASPAIGIFNMFSGISTWFLYNWDDNSCWSITKKATLIIIQILMMTFLYIYLFDWNYPVVRF